jgi:hypothetical protein
MVNTGREARLAMVAGRHGGAFTFRQALDLGYSRATISRRLRSGAWVRVHAGVYVFGGAPTTRTTELWAAVLAAGAGSVVTHESAALLHGAERLPTHPLTLTAPHGTHHHLLGVFVHQIDDLAASHRTTWERIPVSTAPRAVVELGATQSVAVVGRVADDLVRAGRTSYAAIGSVLAQVTRPGKPGLVTVAKVLELRGDGHVPPASHLERMLFDTLEAGGLPPPVRQLPLPGRGAIAGIADGGYLDAKIVLEADGRRWHARVEAARRDRERDAQVARAGWVTLRFVHEQLRDDPAGVCAVVEDTRATRLLQLSSAA